MSIFENLAKKLGGYKTHVKNVKQLADALYIFHESREQTYKLSFARRGHVGIYMNVMRKCDRVESVAQRFLEEGKDGVVLVDTMVDMAMYSLKWLDAIKQTDRAVFVEWITTVYCKDTGMRINDAMALFGLVDDNTYFHGEVGVVEIGSVAWWEAGHEPQPGVADVINLGEDAEARIHHFYEHITKHALTPLTQFATDGGRFIPGDVALDEMRQAVEGHENKPAP